MPTPSFIRRMGHSAAGLALGLTVISAPTVWAAPTPGPESAPSPLDAILESARGSVDLNRDATTGRAVFLTVNGKNADLAPTASSARSARPTPPATKAASWLSDHADLFGVEIDDLVLTDEITGSQGRTLTYHQRHDGVPVWGAALKANLDTDGRLTSVNGRLIPDVDVHTEASSTPAAMVAAATALVRQDPPTDEAGTPAPTDDLAGEATLVIYETGSPQGRAGVRYLAWDVTVTGNGLRERVILADHGAKPLNRWTDSHALTRVLESHDSPDDEESFVVTWREGESQAGLTDNQRALLTSTEESYHFFNTAFGRDSWDGEGAPMRVRDNRMDSCPNASWTGEYTTFCLGVDSDDVVAHEWGHAYTQGTSDLLYQYQSGALNESYSDVWGETVDLLNGREDEGEDLSVRSDDSCLERVSLRFVEPLAEAGNCTVESTGIDRLKLIGERTVSVVNAANTAVPPSTSTLDACGPLTNADAVAGRWLYADRGDCEMQVQADNALAAGAEGLIIGDAGDPEDSRIPRQLPVTSTLPVLLVAAEDAAKLRRIGSITAQGAPKVTVTGPGDAGGRWMMGEKTGAINEPVRDMWNPNCMGDPAKVTDAEYHCSEEDAGGVHVNSGVPNRAYSLFVDGGTFNGRTVAGVGLDRAAHVWWRAGAAHLVWTSNFSDFADALSVSCSTLIGETLTPLSVTATPGDTTVAPITAAQCEALDDVIDATELRTDPTEACSWTPHFEPGSPASPCGTGTSTVTALSAGFEDGATDWRRTSDNGAPWRTVSEIGGNTGTAMVAPNLDSCAVSRAGTASLRSPAVTIAAGALSPRLTFRHLVALEPDYDGANVKVRVTSPQGVAGQWTVPPRDAWIHNGPQRTILDWEIEEETDNPMRLQDAWTGFDPLNLDTAWGTSVLDLAAAGAAPGSTVELRFDLGTDYCGGLIGWAVDDVVVSWCEADAPVAPPTTPPTTPPSVLPPHTPTATPARTRSTLTVTRGGKKISSLKRGRAFTLTSTVRTAPAGTSQRVRGGRVKFYVGGRAVGSAPVVNGKARLKVSSRKSRSLKVGKRAVRGAFQGTRTAQKSTGRATVRLRR